MTTEWLGQSSGDEMERRTDPTREWMEPQGTSLDEDELVCPTIGRAPRPFQRSVFEDKLEMYFDEEDPIPDGSGSRDPDENDPIAGDQVFKRPQLTVASEDSMKPQDRSSLEELMAQSERLLRGKDHATPTHTTPMLHTCQIPSSPYPLRRSKKNLFVNLLLLQDGNHIIQRYWWRPGYYITASS